MPRVLWVLYVASALAALGCSESAPAADAGSEAGVSAISLERAMKDYSKWPPRQAAPRAISAEIFSLCRLPSLPEQKFTESVHGNSLALRDWTNDLAMQGLKTKDKPFPAGAAIVKQKLQGTKLIALGLMVKRAKGYDPAHGDWQFGYWEEASGLKSGAEPASACGDCHAGAKTDYVFADDSWRMPR
jgi:cytochrome P460